VHGTATPPEWPGVPVADDEGASSRAHWLGENLLSPTRNCSPAGDELEGSHLPAVFFERASRMQISAMAPPAARK